MRVATMAAVTVVMALLLSGCWREEADEIIDNLSWTVMVEEMDDACEAHCESLDACGPGIYWVSDCADVCRSTSGTLADYDRWECAETYTALYACLGAASCAALASGYVCEGEDSAVTRCLMD